VIDIKAHMEVDTQKAGLASGELQAGERVFLGPGDFHQEQHEAAWLVLIEDERGQRSVGTVHAYYDGIDDAHEYEGSLFGWAGFDAGFSVSARRIDTVLVHLGLELGRRNREATKA